LGKRRVLAESRLEQLARLTREVGAAAKAAEDATAEADRTALAAGQAETTLRGELAALETSRKAQRALADQLATRIDGALRETTVLSEQDAYLVSELARRAEVRRKEEEERLAREAEARRQAQEAAARAASAAAGVTGPVQTAWVRGIEVNVLIAPNLEAMMTHAQKDGIVLTGSGFRTMDEQIAIRRAVCGPTDYDVWVKPSWECSPPVARPGFSMHQLGLAVDFTLNGGDLVRNSGDRIVQWLHANANTYGFYNLPSEPWHWSVNGR
jgi:hypothetical protein